MAAAPFGLATVLRCHPSDPAGLQELLLANMFERGTLQHRGEIKQGYLLAPARVSRTMASRRLASVVLCLLPAASYGRQQLPRTASSLPALPSASPSASRAGSASASRWRLPVELATYGGSDQAAQVAQATRAVEAVHQQHELDEYNRRSRLAKPTDRMKNIGLTGTLALCIGVGVLWAGAYLIMLRLLRQTLRPIVVRFSTVPLEASLAVLGVLVRLRTMSTSPPRATPPRCAPHRGIVRRSPPRTARPHRTTPHHAATPHHATTTPHRTTIHTIHDNSTRCCSARRCLPSSRVRRPSSTRSDARLGRWSCSKVASMISLQRNTPPQQGAPRSSPWPSSTY